MRRYIFLFVLVSVLSLFFCTGKRAGKKEGKLTVGLVFDVGGRGDKSFNDAAYNGLIRARDSLGIEFQYIEPSGAGGGDREAGLRELAAKGFDLIFGIGFMFSDDITKIAREFPNQKFACIDYTVKEGESIPENLLALKFKEEEGSFLVGVIAGLMTKTNIVGFVGGMDIPLIHKFEAGYRAGVMSVNPSCKVLVGYAGLTGEAFKNPGKGKELALAQYNKGADIIFHASGSTGLGVFEAAREKNRFAIGVDSDQWYEAPGYVLTSMIKRVDNAVFETIRDAINGNFKGGVKELGLKENGVGYVYDENNKTLIPDEVIQKVEEMKAKLIAGEIKVPKE